MPQPWASLFTFIISSNPHDSESRQGVPIFRMQSLRFGEVLLPTQGHSELWAREHQALVSKVNPAMHGCTTVQVFLTLSDPLFLPLKVEGKPRSCVWPEIVGRNRCYHS